MKLTRKQQGDAGEHYVAAMLGFNGLPAVVMPDGWPGYDLMVRDNIRVQVKTVRKWTPKGNIFDWIAFAPECEGFDYLAAVVLGDEPECWLIPTEVLLLHARRPGSPEVKDQNWWLNYNDLNGVLKQYRDAWRQTD